MEWEEDFFGDGAQGGERLGEEIPAIPALDASEVHPKGSEAEKKRDGDPSDAMGSCVVDERVDAVERRHPKQQAVESKAEEQDGIEPKGEVAWSEMDQVRDQVGGVGEEQQPEQAKQKQGEGKSRFGTSHPSHPKTKEKRNPCEKKIP